MGSCNTLNDLSNRIYVPNKTMDLNFSVFNMKTGMNNLEVLTNHKPNLNASLKVVNVTQIKSGIMVPHHVTAKNKKKLTPA